MYEVYHVPEYDKRFKKLLSPEEQEQVLRYEHERLTVNPFCGNSIGPRIFREARFGVKRIYWLIYEGSLKVLMVNVSSKNDQQATIDYIRDRIDEYDNTF